MAFVPGKPLFLSCSVFVYKFFPETQATKSRTSQEEGLAPADQFLLSLF